MKKALSLILALTLCIGLLAGCGNKTADPATPVDEGSDQLTIAWVASDMSDENLAYTTRVMEDYCAEKGIKLLTFDGKANAQTQANFMSNAISQNVDAIIIDTIDTAALGTTLMEVKEAGIIMGTVISDVDEMYQEYRDFYVGLDDNIAGEIAGGLFIEQFKDKDEAKVVCVEGATGSSPQIRRHDGFAAGIEGANINVIDSKTCSAWSIPDAMTIAEDFLTKYGSDLDGIFCHWDNGGTGVREALKAAGFNPGDVFMVTVDGCYAGFDLIRDGWSYASVMQDSTKIAQLGIDYVIQLSEGGTVPSITNPDPILITKDNVDDIDPGW